MPFTRRNLRLSSTGPLRNMALRPSKYLFLPMTDMVLVKVTRKVPRRARYKWAEVSAVHEGYGYIHVGGSISMIVNVRHGSGLNTSL